MTPWHWNRVHLVITKSIAHNSIRSSCNWTNKKYLHCNTFSRVWGIRANCRHWDAENSDDKKISQYCWKPCNSLFHFFDLKLWENGTSLLSSDPPWVMGTVPATTSALPALWNTINPIPDPDADPHPHRHLLYGGGYLCHDGGGRVEDGRGGRGGWQPAANVLVPDKHSDDDGNGKTYKEIFKNKHWRKLKQFKPVLVC